MRLSSLTFLGVSLVAAAVVAAGCGGNSDTHTSGTTSSGAGGTGGATASSTTTGTASSTTGTGGGGAGNGMPSDHYPAPHPAPPQVVNLGGPVLASPKIYPVFFSNDDATTVASIEDFVSHVGGTAYWTANTTEYGVGAATSGAPILLTEAAPATIDDSAIQTWLAAKLNSNDAAFPATVNPDAIFIIYYPASVTITLQGGLGGGTESSCTTFGGYHQSITLDAAHGNQPVAYAVVPRCSNFGGMSALDATTSSSSHELIEASTNPYPESTPAYAQVDEDHIYWLFALGGGETGDMCAQNPGAFTTFPGLAYQVQRTWSNQAALAGHNPCVPALPGEVYFNAVPVLNDDITVNIGQSVTFKGVKIAQGQSKTIDVDLFSDASTGGDFTVEAKDFSALMGGPASLSFSFDRDHGQNGEKLHLTITVDQKNQFSAEPFLLLSSQGQGQTNLWVGIVGN